MYGDGKILRFLMAIAVNLLGNGNPLTYG